MKFLRKRIIFLLTILVILSVGGVILYLISTGRIVPQAAVTGVTLALSPSSGSKVINTNFDVNIVLNTNGQSTAGTDAILTYNPLDLQVQDADAVTSGVQIKAGTLYASYPANTVDATTGKIMFSGIITPGGVGFTGSGTLATITFKALRTVSSSQVNFVFTLDATNDSNVTSNTTYQDLLASVTNGNYNLVPPDVTFNFSYTLQGRTNHSASGMTLKIYPVGGVTPVYTNSNLTGSSTGSGTTIISGLSSSNYDFQLKAPYFLSTRMTNVALASPLTLNFGAQKAGDLSNDNIVNSLDFSILNNKWGQSDLISDINQDGITNTIDFAILNFNWFVQGQ